MDPEFLWHLELYRFRLGRPVFLLSAYRSLYDNRRVGGAKYSQHLYGRAADLAPGSRVSLETLVGWRIFTGLGVSADGRVSHVDTRHGSADWPAIWHYS